MATEKSTNASKAGACKSASSAPKKKRDVKITTGILTVKTTENNTMITLADENGNKIVGSGTWIMWYKGSKKSTPYAAEVLTKQILKEAQGYGLKEIVVIFRWPGLARDGVFKAINEIGLIDIQCIKEETAIQFGGCKGTRPKRI